MSDEIQIVRQASLVDAELKGRMFRGYAAVFDQPWDDALVAKHGYIERVARGAFRKALTRKDNVPFLLGHDRNMVLGTTGSGNVKITEEPKGLLTTAKLPDNHLGEYARSMIESGDLRGMSFGVRLNRQADVERSQSGNGIPVMTIRNARRMHDVSLTWEPSYPDATVELRSQEFVAIPLQESGGGEETQPTPSGDEDQTPDESQTAWWVEESADADKEPDIPYWERLARQLEREH